MALSSRQAALTALKRYVLRCWSDTYEDFRGPLASPEIKNHLRPQLLTLATDNQRKVRTISAAMVGKIATSGASDVLVGRASLADTCCVGQITQKNGRTSSVTC